MDKFLMEAVLKVSEAQTDSGMIEAMATTWGKRIGSDGRRFDYRPEGFKDWVDEFNESDKPLAMFYNHDDEEIPVGEWTEFEITEEGLYAKGRLYLNTQRGKDLYTIMKEAPKMLNSVSVGAFANEAIMVDEEGNETSHRDGYFRIVKGGLAELSIVMRPNNPNATINKLEFFFEDLNPNLKNIEQSLREVGLSRAQATAAASVLKNVLEQREALIATLTEQHTVETRDEEDAAVNEEVLMELQSDLEMLKLEQALTQLKKE